jgi:hypothetical protein
MLRRESFVPWLCGALLGFLAYLPANFHLGAGGPTWSGLLLCAIVSAPIHIVVDLTFPLWGYLGAPGHWLVAALTACLYHGTVAVWLARVYRRQPRRALLFGGVLLVLHFCLYVIWQNISLARLPPR